MVAAYGQFTDALADIRQLLLGSPEVQMIVGDLVFAAELPQERVQSMPERCVVVTSGGGQERNSYTPYAWYRFDVRHYGETYFQAFQTRNAVASVLKAVERRVVGGTLFHSLQCVSGPMQLREQDYRWPLIFDTYLALVGQVPVS